MELLPVIGLEIHVQLKTKSKMFCKCDNSGADQKPNTTICPICMGHPGTLPYPNEQAVAWGVLIGLALNCEILKQSKFDRKNYFYPDLPKGYQISQYDKPIGINGWVLIKDDNGEDKKVRITRIHLEEDAAKLTHDKHGHSLVDYNRAGTPLAEIVTEPDLRTPLEAKRFLQKLRQLMRYIEVSNADMEKGQLRCDVNISLNKIKDNNALNIDELNPKTEIKNVNSFKAVQNVLEYEIKRQNDLWENGKGVKKQSTRGWNEDKGISEEQRTKEGEKEYRYFPEPDIPPLNLKVLEDDIKSFVPELPDQKMLRFKEEYAFKYKDIILLTEDKNLADWTEHVMSELRSWILTQETVEGSEQEIWDHNKEKLCKLSANWITTRLFALMSDNKETIEDCNITPENFAELLTLVYQNKVNQATALKILEIMYKKKGSDPSQILKEEDLSQISSENVLLDTIKVILDNSPDEVKAYKEGKEVLFQFFLGQVMKETKGRANPSVANEILKKLLK